MDSQIDKDNTILISPVTRIEGHAKITIDAWGQMEKCKDARFHVNEFRGFEKFCEGRLFYGNAVDHPAYLRDLSGQPFGVKRQSLRDDHGD